MKHKKVAVITGGTRGIGKACVLSFLAAGYRVFYCSRSKHSGTGKEMQEAEFFQCDLGDKASIESFTQNIKSQTQTVDVLINNAGIAGTHDLESESADAFWYQVVDTNLTGPYLMIRNLLPIMAEGGSILNVGSVLSHIGVPDQVAYCAAKHGLIGLTKSLARRLAPRKIRVNAISPGWVDTDMATDRSRELDVSKADLAESVPLGKMVKPQEIADLALFVTGPSGASITGQSLVVDGGTLA